jgi:hypothetical protein
LRNAAAEVEEGGGLSAMIVLLLKHIHLQKDAAVDFAAQAKATKNRLINKYRWPVERIMAKVGSSMSRSSLLVVRTRKDKEDKCSGSYCA